MLVIRVLYVKVWLPLARPTPATLTSTSWVPVPAPKVHTSWVGLAVVTGQSTPPIVTVLSAGVAPKEVPVMVRVAPEKSTKSYTYMSVTHFSSLFEILGADDFQRSISFI